MSRHANTLLLTSDLRINLQGRVYALELVGIVSTGVYSCFADEILLGRKRRKAHRMSPDFLGNLTRGSLLLLGS